MLNAQSTATGFVRSPIGQNWTHAARLSAVDYGAGGGETDAPTGETATVTAPSGSTVKLRERPSTDCALWHDVPVGATVTVTGAPQDGWTPVAYGRWVGWMMARYLQQGAPEGAASWLARGLTAAQAREIAGWFPNAVIAPENE